MRKFNIKDLRALAGMTQEQLAERAGVSTRTLQRAEAGKPLDADVAQAIAGALGVQVDDILGPTREEVIAKEAKFMKENNLIRMPRVESGDELVRAVRGCSAWRHSFDHPSSDEAREALSAFLESIGDSLDIISELGAGEALRMAESIDDDLKTLEAAGYKVFVCTRKQHFKASLVNAAEQKELVWDELIVYVADGSSEKVRQASDGEFIISKVES